MPTKLVPSQEPAPFRMDAASGDLWEQDHLPECSTTALENSAIDSNPSLPASEPPNWINFVQQSQVLLADLEPSTLVVRFANAQFCHLMGIDGAALQQGGLNVELLELLKGDRTLLDAYRQHILYRVLGDLYGIHFQGRLLNEPILLTVSDLSSQSRYIQVWLRSDAIKIKPIQAHVDDFADLNLQQMTPAQMQVWLAAPDRVQALGQRLRLENYQIEGSLLLEGLDVTEQETIRRITQLLIDQDSILKPEKFEQVNRLMQHLFRSQNTVIVSIEGDRVHLFRGSVSHTLDTAEYSLQMLQGSHFLRSIETNQVTTVPDLALEPPTQYGQQLLKSGIRSLLLMPLVCQIKDLEVPVERPVGLVGIVSHHPNQFDGLDCHYAQQLIPAFTTAVTAALRKMVQQRFINSIHPAVEWRFAQEAERRSWGLSPEPILFTGVYPLYGISDIRGSSAERNRAIQQDLLEQFHLGVAVVEAVCQFQTSALAEQIRWDLLDYIARLQDRVTVDAELTGIKYLSTGLEIYFDYFTQCGTAAKTAIAAYRAACNNEHKCVYVARARYDETLICINARLRQTWEHWQDRMQQIIPHYCDIEATDGIDHMIYVGESIDPKFSFFHLRSLRYEQLRAVCDCARAAFHIQTEFNTSMEVTHLVLVQDVMIDIFHDEKTERLFDVRGTRDTRYEIVKKRIDKATDTETQTRITQPGMLTLVYSTDEEWREYHQYLTYLMREGWIDLTRLATGTVEPLQGLDGLKFARVPVLAARKAAS
jgi:hypothetical protein